MEFTDGQTMRCARHGGEFQVLFARTPLPAPLSTPPALAEPPLTLQQSAACAYHPSQAAVGTCSVCGAAICGSCDVPRFDGSHICRNCLGQVPVASLLPYQEPAAPMVVGQAPVAPLRLKLEPAAPPIISAVRPVSPFPPGVYCVQHAKVQ